MGVPVSPRNIFPSNIQGLPTWYEVRVSERGYLARRGGVDLMVAMNPQTWDKDLAEIEPGGYLLYDSSKPMPPSKFRDDIHVLGVPLTDLCATPLHRSARAPAAEEHRLRRRARGDARRRARGHRDAARRAVQGQGPSCSQPNLDAFMMGLHHGSEYFDDALGLQDRARATRSASASSSKATPPPRSAASTAARRSAPGIRSRRARRSPRRSRSTARSCASTRRPAQNKFAIVQAEDEIASIGIVVGAGWNGARAFTDDLRARASR